MWAQTKKGVDNDVLSPRTVECVQLKCEVVCPGDNNNAGADDGNRLKNASCYVVGGMPSDCRIITDRQAGNMWHASRRREGDGERGAGAGGRRLTNKRISREGYCYYCLLRVASS